MRQLLTGCGHILCGAVDILVDYLWAVDDFGGEGHHSLQIHVPITGFAFYLVEDLYGEVVGI